MPRPDRRTLALATWIVARLGACATPEDLGPDPSSIARVEAPVPLDAPPILDPTRLHRIAIEVDPSFLPRLENDRDDRVPCALTIDGETVTNAGIRQKGSWGSSSELDERPAFSVRFDEFAPGRRFQGLRKLLLNNALQDPSLLNEHLGYEVARRAGLPAPYTAHAVVSLNGRVDGVYVVREAIDEDFLARNFGARAVYGNLYEGECCDDFVGSPDRLDLKRERQEGRSRADIRELAHTIATAPDEDFEALVSAELDLPRYLTSFAVDADLHNWDSYHWTGNNYYLYHDPQTARFVLIPHGMDQLLQRLSFNPFWPPCGRLAERVRSIPDLDARYRAELVRVLEEVWDLPVLLARIDRTEAVLAAAAGEAPEDLAEFRRRVEGVRYDLVRRRAYLLYWLGRSPAARGPVDGGECPWPGLVTARPQRRNDSD